MNWNYRIIRQDDEYGDKVYGICEVYYDEEGNVDLWTEPVEMYFEEDKLDMLILLITAFMKPTLEEKDGHLFYEKAKPACGDKELKGFSIRAADADE